MRSQCDLPSIPESGVVDQIDLYLSYLGRGQEIVNCDAKRQTAVTAHDQEHEAEEVWLDSVRKRLKSQGK